MILPQGKCRHCSRHIVAREELRVGVELDGERVVDYATVWYHKHSDRRNCMPRSLRGTADKQRIVAGKNWFGKMADPIPPERRL